MSASQMLPLSLSPPSGFRVETAAPEAIPRVLHYCWYGRNRMDELHLRCIESWSKHFGDFELIRWDETNSPMDLPYIAAATAQQRWSKISNLMRLLAVGQFGGIYLDTDVEAFRSFRPLLQKRCFVAFQLRQADCEHDPCWVNNAILGATPNHSFVRACAERTLRSFDECGIFEVSSRITTDVLRQHGLRSSCAEQTVAGVSVLPRETFYPFHWTEPTDPSRIGDATYAVHHWNFSWRDRI